MTVRVAIRSDRRLVHDALAACLSTLPDTTVVGHVTSGRDLLDLCRLQPPDLVVFDAGADLATSGWVLTDLVAQHPRLRLLVTYEDLTRAGVSLAARIGIDTLMPHAHGLPALLAAVRHHAAVLAEPPLDGASGSADDPAEGAVTPELTDQEREILTLLGAGHTAGRVAQLLAIKPSRVENSKRRIYRKMRVASQSHAIARAATLGLMDRPVAPPLRRAPCEGPFRVRVLGPDTALRREVAATLARCRVPFRIDDVDPVDGTVTAAGPAGPAPMGPDGPTAAVAVISDPEPDDWPAVDRLDVPVLLVWSRPLPVADAIAALSRGVAGLVPAHRLEHDLVPALALACAGYLTISAALGHTLITEVRHRPGGETAARPELTAREHDILASIAAGDSVRQTARALGIAGKTVENIQARLFRKLGVHNRAGAVAAAHALGLLAADPR